MNGTPDRAEGTGSAEGTGFGLPEPGAGDEGGSRLADDACSEAGSEGEGQSFATFVAEVGQLKDMVKLMDREENVDARMCAILERYQEQPQLLDTHIESLVTPLAEAVRVQTSDREYEEPVRFPLPLRQCLGQCAEPTRGAYSQDVRTSDDIDHVADAGRSAQMTRM